jgi:phage shock protein PspC (stress-responsive transcriptional regulator)
MKEETKMYRPKGDRVVGGVCSGIAYDMNVDPLIFRVISFCLIFSPVPIILIYILLWLLIPGEKDE